MRKFFRFGRPGRSTRRIVAVPKTGLGNRLRCITSLMRIAGKIGAEFSFIWPVNEECAAPFEDLYDKPLCLREPSEIPDTGLGLNRGEEIYLFEDDCNERAITAVHLRYPILNVEAAHFYLLESKPGEAEPRNEAIRESGDILRGFPLNAYVAEQVEEWSRAFEIAHRVGVHVRRGDALRWRIIALSRFLERLENKYAGARLFTASDDHEVLRTFERKFGDRVAIYPARSRVRSERVAVQDAMIEMLLLSRTRLILTGPSSFSEVAAMIGDRRRDVLHPE